MPSHPEKFSREMTMPAMARPRPRRPPSDLLIWDRAMRLRMKPSGAHRKAHTRPAMASPDMVAGMLTTGGGAFATKGPS